MDEDVERLRRRKMMVLGHNRRGMKLAVVVTDSKEAEKLEKLEWK